MRSVEFLISTANVWVYVGEDTGSGRGNILTHTYTCTPMYISEGLKIGVNQRTSAFAYCKIFPSVQQLVNVYVQHYQLD